VTRFTPDRRERFLTLLEVGRNVEEACAKVKVGRATISRWAASGREAEPGSERAEFARRFDDVRGRRTATSLTSADVVRMLEKSALKGSVQAMKLLLVRLEKQEGPEAAPDAAPDEEDPFAALEGDQLAQRRRARRSKRPA